MSDDVYPSPAVVLSAHKIDDDIWLLEPTADGVDDPDSECMLYLSGAWYEWMSDNSHWSGTVAWRDAEWASITLLRSQLDGSSRCYLLIGPKGTGYKDLHIIAADLKTRALP